MKKNEGDFEGTRVVDMSKRTIHPDYDDSQFIIDGFPTVPNGERVVIQPIEASQTLQDLGNGKKIIMVESKNNQSRIARIMAISPDLFLGPLKERYPTFTEIYKPGDLVYFNHLAGNHMNVRIHGEMKETYSMYIGDILGKFLHEEEYFGRIITPGSSVEGASESTLALDKEAAAYKEQGTELKNLDIPHDVTIE